MGTGGVLGGKGGVCLSGLDNVRPKLAGRKLSHEVLCAWGAGQHFPVWLVNQKKSLVCLRRRGLLVLGAWLLLLRLLLVVVDAAAT